MKPRFTIFFQVFLSAFLACSSATIASNVVMDLGTLGGSFSSANSINNKGQVVGYSVTVGGESHAFLWDNDNGMRDLGTLGGSSSNALCINDSGYVVGYSETIDGSTHAFIWHPDTGMQDLGTLGGSDSFAWDINENGQVVGYSDVTPEVHHAFVWDSINGMRDLGTLGGTNSEAYGINNAGQIVGASRINDNSWDWRAFVWDGVAGMRNIGTFGGNSSSADAINDNGQVVGVSYTESWNRQAFLWQSGIGMIDIGISGSYATGAVGINQGGQVVGWVMATLNTLNRPFLWDTATGAEVLETLGGRDSQASSINDVGQVTGAATTVDGDWHAFVILLDADGDDMPDNWESQNGLNPLRNDAENDPDGDGFVNLQEYHAGSHPLNSQSRPGSSVVLVPYAPYAAYDRTPTLTWYPLDGATAYRIQIDDTGNFTSLLIEAYVSGATQYTIPFHLPDGEIYWRVASNLNYDRFSSANHFVVTSTPIDMDGDGMADAWEKLHALNPNLNDATEDADTDGFTNLQEYVADTNPNDGSSLPALGYTIFDLGTLGGAHSSAHHINTKGQIVGTSDTAEGLQHAFLWDHINGMRGLGTLGGESSEAIEINNSGQIVGNSRTEAGETHAFLWERTKGMQDLGTLGGGYSRAHAINNIGQVVGTSDRTDGIGNAFLWSPTSGMLDLGVEFYYYGGELQINDSGQVAGTMLFKRIAPFKASFVQKEVTSDQVVVSCRSITKVTTTTQYVPTTTIYPGDYEIPRAFIWDSANGLQTLGDIYSEAYSLNDFGYVTGEDDSRAALWDASGTPQDLGMPVSAGGHATHVNNSGQVLGISQTGSEPFHLFLWSAETGYQDLGSFSGNYIYSRSFNDAGQIVGRVYTNDYSDHAFMWDKHVGMQILGHDLTVYFINDAGLIVGEWEKSPSETHAFLMTPADLDSDGNGLPDEWESNPENASFYPPDAPSLDAPENGTADVSLTPKLSTQAFNDPDAGNVHAGTQWQVSTAPDFSSLTLAVKSRSALKNLTIPDLVLDAGATYYWRARFFDNGDLTSEWSQARSFTTISQWQEDLDADGVPDRQEVGPTVDLDGNGSPDVDQPDIKCVHTVIGDKQIGVKCSAGVKIEAIKSIAPDTITDAYGMPGKMTFGLVSFRIKVANPGDTATVTIYLLEPVDPDARWYKYNQIDGWQDYSNDSAFSSDRTSVVLELKDGGIGDADGTANGIIIDPSGPGTVSVSETPSAPSGGGNGNSCFIATAAFGSPFERHVVILRKFRDVCLIPTSLGAALVKIYYRYSPPLADMIRSRSVLRTLIRCALLPILGLCWVFIHVGMVPALLIIALSIVLIIKCFSFLRATRLWYHLDR